MLLLTFVLILLLMFVSMLLMMLLMMMMMMMNDDIWYMIYDDDVDSGEEEILYTTLHLGDPSRSVAAVASTPLLAHQWLFASNHHGNHRKAQHLPRGSRTEGNGFLKVPPTRYQIAPNSSNDPKMKRSDIVCVCVSIFTIIYIHQESPGCLILGKLIREKGWSWEANPNPSLSPKKGPPDRACTLPLSK